MTQSASSGLLNRIEAIGNKIPHPTLLFIWMSVAILLLSALFAALGTSAQHPVSGASINAVNLLSAEGLRLALSKAVTNFTHFAPVGTVLVAMLGIGVAEHSGLLGTALRLVVLKAPRSMLSSIVVFAGVLSSLAADSGYVVLIPLAAIVFVAAGRHPVAGIAAAFAGVSGGYSANLMVGPIDAILGGISSEAIKLVSNSYTVEATGNYYFLIVSTFLITLLGSWVTERFVVPHLGEYQGDTPPQESIKAEEMKALKVVAVFTLAFIALLLLLLVPENAPLRNPDTGSITNSPFIKGIVTVIALYAAIAGYIFGRVSGNFKRAEQMIHSMENTMATMASYLVLMFFAAQFVNYFAWSNLGLLFAINGAEWIKSLALPASLLVAVFVMFAATANLFIGSASAKWAVVAPIFVPMLYLVGIAPETTQMAFRIGDSTTNIITPLMPYFGVVLAFVQRYDKQAGMGTIIAMMLPYSLFFLVAWTLLLVIWLGLGIPLGPDVPLVISTP